jgi:hypothetical protein
MTIWFEDSLSCFISSIPAAARRDRGCSIRSKETISIRVVGAQATGQMTITIPASPHNPNSKITARAPTPFPYFRIETQLKGPIISAHHFFHYFSSRTLDLHLSTPVIADSLPPVYRPVQFHEDCRFRSSYSYLDHPQIFQTLINHFLERALEVRIIHSS